MLGSVSDDFVTYLDAHNLLLFQTGTVLSDSWLRRCSQPRNWCPQVLLAERGESLLLPGLRKAALLKPAAKFPKNLVLRIRTCCVMWKCTTVKERTLSEKNSQLSVEKFGKKRP